MTMIDTLFGLIPAASRGQQWIVDELQLVNWGGYDGVHRVRFSPTATMLCGGSGSGKSTLMDAYIALMMPHTTPFNGASNGGVTGRPRGEEQRNILSYGRGKLDETRTESGTHVRTLRGDGVDTWTAIAATWVDHDGSRFTAVRAWYIPATARVLDDAVKVRGTVAGDFELGSLEAAAGQRLADAAVRAAGLETVATDREFSARVHSVLGIGAAGGGSKAMSLLARIQAGQQITTVDELYKRMVLEEPETMATADAVVAHFDELESTRARMVTAQKQVRALSPIRGMRERIEAATDRVRIVDQVGSFSDAGSLATLWRNQHRLELLRGVEAELRRRSAAADADVQAQLAVLHAAEAERDGLAEVLRGAGGDRLETAERELDLVRRKLDEVTRERERFDALLASLEEEAPASEKDFAALAERARQVAGDPEAKRGGLSAFADARAAKNAASTRLNELRAELRTAQGRADNIPTALHHSRELLARAAGLSPEELPFVGELVEVRTEFEPWRDAFNLALGGFATTLLIDAAHRDAFRAAIDAVSIPTRLRYESVETGLRVRSGLDPQRLPGRLDYREGPFTGWLQERLERTHNFVCVDAASELRRHSQALTISGQVSQGGGGAHGGHGRSNVLGFSSSRRVAELETAIERAQREHAAAERAEVGAGSELDAQDARRNAYARLADLAWDRVDVVGVQREVSRWEGVISEVTGSNPKIAELQQRLDKLRAKTARAHRLVTRAEMERDREREAWAAVSEDVDAAQSAVDAADDAGRSLSGEQLAFLGERFGGAAGVAARAADGAGAGGVAGASGDGTRGEGAAEGERGGVGHQAESPERLLARFDTAMDSASRRLEEERRAAHTTIDEQRENLRRTFEHFLQTWPNPTLRADPDTSLADFERILAELETSGLHRLEAEWRASLLRLSGNDLTNLDSSLSRALREIRERIEPVNRIMEELPFYDDEHRLIIAARESSSEVRRRFRKELREVRGLIEAASTDEDRAAVYARMEKLIGRIRRTAPDFAELVDVRQHVRISAEKIHAGTREHVALYDHIGEKSGGESQELIAFIVGAALRYQLGDADSSRPRYAPVFLDEALIKADAHFTKRAIGAWRGLGFQLIIGAPNDKYSAIEPHVDVEYDILKDTSGRSWARPKVGLGA